MLEAGVIEPIVGLDALRGRVVGAVGVEPAGDAPAERPGEDRGEDRGHDHRS